MSESPPSVFKWLKQEEIQKAIFIGTSSAVLGGIILNISSASLSPTNVPWIEAVTIENAIFAGIALYLWAIIPTLLMYSILLETKALLQRRRDHKIEEATEQKRLEMLDHQRIHTPWMLPPENGCTSCGNKEKFRSNTPVIEGSLGNAAGTLIFSAYDGSGRIKNGTARHFEIICRTCSNRLNTYWEKKDGDWLNVTQFVGEPIRRFNEHVHSYSAIKSIPNEDSYCSGIANRSDLLTK